MNCTLVGMTLLAVCCANLAFAGGEITAPHARFKVITSECIRLEYSPDDHFVDSPSLFAINRNTDFKDFQVSYIGNQTIIQTEKIKLTYTPNGKPFSRANLKVEIQDDAKTIIWTPGMTNQKNLGGTKNLDDIQGPIKVDEGLIARDGWHVIDDSSRLLLTEHWAKERPSTGNLDWYFFGYGHDFKGALKSLTTISGEVPLPRKYVFGSWYSRWWPYSSTDYRKIVQEYHDHDFPLDIVVMDMDWHKKDNWTGYTFNPELFPDGKEYLAWLHDHRLFATFNDHLRGGVGPFEDNYASFMKELGHDPAKNETLPMNAGNEKYMTAMFKHMQKPLLNSGADFLWLDYWEESKENIFNHNDWVNEVYYRNSQESGLRGLNFARWGGWGDHRHSIHFSGDAFVKWNILKFEVPFTANSGNVGLFFWSHDIGGYQGKRNGELFARWAQFGTFSAILRLHSRNYPTLDKRPWTYSKEIEDSLRISFHLRSQLLPYIYSSSWQAHRDSTPFIKPLYIEFPNIEEAYKNPQEYLYGDAFLVAPITHQGVGPNKISSQKVWFPQGKWYNWFTGESYGQYTKREIAADLNSFPLFVRGGMPIPMEPYTERMATEPLKALVIRAFPGEEGVTQDYTLYEDDGLTTEYTSGRHGLTVLSYVNLGDDTVVTINPTVGTFQNQLQSRSYVVELPLTERPSEVKINAVSVPFVYEASTSTTRITIPEHSIGEALVIKVSSH